MELLVSSPWIVVVIAFVCAAAASFSGKAGALLAPALASVGSVLVLALSWGVLSTVTSSSAADGPWTSSLASTGSITWFAAGEAAIGLGWALDTLTAVMLGVVGLVSLCVVVFSVGYMHGDPGWNRYFGLLSLFTGSMTMLVVGDGFATLFVGWELVGACSYLLIGFWFAKPAASKAAIKAFLTTRVGDVAMLVGMGILWWTMGTLTYEGVAEGLREVPAAWTSAAALLIAVGAIGKSAQFPLHAWLPDAMEGPTPVSALIHAATMVAAGVFVVARVWPLFESSAATLDVLLYVGLVSALGAALVATVQRDIKKVLAYSTVSQLGFMFAALGSGAWEAAFFHLVAHAAFKGLLFLTSGSVIHGTGTQDIHEMGGLRRTMPVTFATWAIGVLALAGLPGLAGFFSKDAVIEAVWHHSPLAGAVLFAAAALTAFYVGRTTRLVFFGAAAPGLHAHESPRSMLVPLAVLSVPALAFGWLGGSLFEILGAEAEPLALGVSAAAVGVGVLGGVAGWFAGATVRSDDEFFSRLGRMAPVLQRAYGWDDMIDRVIIGPVTTASRALWAWGDRLVVDGVVEGAASAARRGAKRIAGMHDGDGQRYATVIAAAVALMLAAAVVVGR